MSREQVTVLAQQFGVINPNDADLDNSCSFKLSSAMKQKAVEYYLGKKSELDNLGRHLHQLGMQVDLPPEVKDKNYQGSMRKDEEQQNPFFGKPAKRKGFPAIEEQRKKV